MTDNTYDHRLPWRFGTGNDCRNIYNAEGALVAQVFENYQDRFLIVDAVNKFARDYKDLGEEA